MVATTLYIGTFQVAETSILPSPRGQQSLDFCCGRHAFEDCHSEVIACLYFLLPLSFALLGLRLSSCPLRDCSKMYWEGFHCSQISWRRVSSTTTWLYATWLENTCRYRCAPLPIFLLFLFDVLFIWLDSLFCHSFPSNKTISTVACSSAWPWRVSLRTSPVSFLRKIFLSPGTFSPLSFSTRLASVSIGGWGLCFGPPLTIRRSFAVLSLPFSAWTVSISGGGHSHPSLSPTNKFTFVKDSCHWTFAYSRVLLVFVAINTIILVDDFLHMAWLHLKLMRPAPPPFSSGKEGHWNSRWGITGDSDGCVISGEWRSITSPIFLRILHFRFSFLGSSQTWLGCWETHPSFQQVTSCFSVVVLLICSIPSWHLLSHLPGRDCLIFSNIMETTLMACHEKKKIPRGRELCVWGSDCS